MPGGLIVCIWGAGERLQVIGDNVSLEKATDFLTARVDEKSFSPSRFMTSNPARRINHLPI
jgi:hypothetical protein